MEFQNESNLLIYQSQEGNIKIDLQLENDTVWLTQEQMAQLFGKGRSTITEHISNIFKEEELEQNTVCRNFRHTANYSENYSLSASNFF
jgi:hypothetical protein